MTATAPTTSMVYKLIDADPKPAFLRISDSTGVSGLATKYFVIPTNSDIFILDSLRFKASSVLTSFVVHVCGADSAINTIYDAYESAEITNGELNACNIGAAFINSSAAKYAYLGIVNSSSAIGTVSAVLGCRSAV